MREILFRGKHIHSLDINKKFDGIWVYGYLCSESYIWSDELGGDMLVDKSTIGQYTGLTDKYGTKIFEGDIIRLTEEGRKLFSPYNAENEDNLCRKDCLVKFENGCFMTGLNKLKMDFMNTYLWIVKDHCEVIGNIYDKEVEE